MAGGNAGSGVIKYPAYLSHIPEPGDSQEGFHYGALLRVRDIVDGYIGWTLEDINDPEWIADDISPYDGMAAYNPDTALSAIDTKVTALDAIVSAYNGGDLWSAAVTAADTAVGSMNSIKDVDARLTTLVTAIRSVLSTQMTNAKASAATTAISAVQAAMELTSNTTLVELIEAAQDDYEKSLMPSYYRGVNRFAGGMADINAVMSSSFVIGMAQMESQLQNQIAKFSADMKLQLLGTLSNQYLQLYASLINTDINSLVQGISLYVAADSDYAKNKAGFVIQAVNEILAANMKGYDLRQNALSATYEANKLRIVAKKEQTDKDADLDVMDARWPIELLTMEGNLIANITGAAHMIDKPTSTAQSAISGAMSMASLASTLTKVPNPYVMAGGAALGVAAALLK